MALTTLGITCPREVLVALQAVGVTAFPLRDDGQMKEYLLESERRLEMVREAGGEVSMIIGSHNLDQLLDDRTFVCLHYHYTPTGMLEPCHTTKAGDSQPHRQRPSLLLAHRACHFSAILDL